MLRVLAIFLVALLAGCEGTSSSSLKRVSDGPGTAPIDPQLYPPDISPTLTCTDPTVAPEPMRRLSHVEYRYAIEDLLGSRTLAETAAATLTRDPSSLGFSNSASLLDVKVVLGQQYMEAAEAVAEGATQNLNALLGCDPASAGELTCATDFVQRFVARAYRRPLSAEEQASYVSGYQSLRTQFDFRTGIEWIVSTALQAPSFLYRVESDIGMTDATRAVQPLELASRLSFFLWHSIPDAELTSAALEGRLSTRADVQREALRMLADPKGARVLNFFEEWLDLDKLGTYTRSSTLFPNLSASLPDLFRQETRSFVKNVVFDLDGKLETLLTADFTFADATLSQHYGLSGVTSSTFQKVLLPASRRGLWMQGGPLTSHDKETRTSIVRRGLRVRTALLCQTVDAPPNNVNLTLGPVDATASQADRLAQHRTDPACAGCHTLLDPLGQVFENVDAVGRLRTIDEGGHVITTSGELTRTDSDGPVASGANMLAKLAQSNEARGCVATQLFRYAHGREEQTADDCSRKQAYERFAASGFNVKELLVGITTSDAFLFRAVVP